VNSKGISLFPSRDKAVFQVLMPLNFFNLPHPSSLTMALGPTQPLTELSTIKSFWGKTQLVHKADNLTAICEPIV
jgi:hypothetical protein